MEKINEFISSKEYKNALEVVVKAKKLNVLSDYYNSLLKIADRKGITVISEDVLEILWT